MFTVKQKEISLYLGPIRETNCILPQWTGNGIVDLLVVTRNMHHGGSVRGCLRGHDNSLASPINLSWSK